MVVGEPCLLLHTQEARHMAGVESRSVQKADDYEYSAGDAEFLGNQEEIPLSSLQQ